MYFEDFIGTMAYMADVFGSLVGMGEKEGHIPNPNDNLTIQEENSCWFLCPECGEPIYYGDWKEEKNDIVVCPICECEYKLFEEGD